MFGCDDSCSDTTNCNSNGFNCNNLMLLMLLSGQGKDINLSDLLLLQFLQKGMNSAKKSGGCCCNK